MDLCVVEGSFTLNLFSIIVSDYVNQGPFDPDLAHQTNVNNGFFDPEYECTTGSLNGAGRSEKECCGTFPNRLPFKVYGGDRACCNGQTYNTNTLMCCDETVTTLTNTGFCDGECPPGVTGDDCDITIGSCSSSVGHQTTFVVGF